MIIFGTRTRHKKIGEGEFFCPRCQKKQPYHHKEGRNYFTLYFVPLIPLNSVGDYIECQVCKGAFQPSVLLMAAPPPAAPDLAQMMNQASVKLKQGTPAEYIIRDLTKTGLERDIAQKTVKSLLGTKAQHCDSCGLTYAENVTTCASCGKSLS